MKHNPTTPDLDENELDTLGDKKEIHPLLVELSCRSCGANLLRLIGFTPATNQLLSICNCGSLNAFDMGEIEKVEPVQVQRCKGRYVG